VLRHSQEAAYVPSRVRALRHDPDAVNVNGAANTGLLPHKDHGTLVHFRGFAEAHGQHPHPVEVTVRSEPEERSQFELTETLRHVSDCSDLGG
jgi:hypothetical protein